MDDEGDITAGADSSWTAKQREAVAAATADSTNSASQGADELAADVATSLDLDGAQHNTAQAAKAAEREELIKDILSAQEGLKALIERVSDVQREGARIKSDNEMLQTYIDNLTRNNAVAASSSSAR